jgi:hypothetical protein
MRNRDDFSPMKEALARLDAAKGAALEIHQRIGSLYALVDSTESVRALGGPTGDQYTAVRKALEKSAADMDAIISALHQHYQTQYAACTAKVEEIQGQALGMARALGIKNPGQPS